MSNLHKFRLNFSTHKKGGNFPAFSSFFDLFSYFCFEFSTFLQQFTFFYIILIVAHFYIRFLFFARTFVDLRTQILRVHVIGNDGAIYDLALASLHLKPGAASRRRRVLFIAQSNALLVRCNRCPAELRPQNLFFLRGEYMHSAFR